MHTGYSSDYIILFVVAYVLVTMPFAVLFHELGHAIPSLIFSREKVKVFVGSMGNAKGMWKMNLGRLEINFRYVPTFLGKGICYSYGETLSVNKKIVRIAGGPFASLLCVAVSCFFIFHFPFDGIWSSMITGFAIASLILLFSSASISSRRVYTEGGRYTFSDFTVIRNLLGKKKFPENHAKAVSLYNDRKFEEAGIRFKKLIDRNFINPDIYVLAITCFMKIKNMEMARIIAEEFERTYPKEAAHYSFSAHVQIQLNDYEKGLAAFQKSLALEPDNLNLQYNCGYSFLQLKRYEEAIATFEKTIAVEPNSGYAFANLGLAKFLNGKTDAGIADIMHSLELDDKNPYGNLNLGIVRLQRNEKAEALKLFLKTKELDASVHLIDKYIAQAKN